MDMIKDKTGGNKTWVYRFNYMFLFKKNICFWDTWLKERDEDELMNANVGYWD